MTPLQDMKRHKANSDRLIADGFAVTPEFEETNTLDKHIAHARKRMGEDRWQQLNREWENG